MNTNEDCSFEQFLYVFMVIVTQGIYLYRSFRKYDSIFEASDNVR